MRPETDWDRLIAGLRGGDEEVVTEFCRDYGSRLQRIAERNIGPGLRRRMGPESVVQSACCSFLRRARAGITGDGMGNVLCGTSGVTLDGSGDVYVTGLCSRNAFKIPGPGLPEDVNSDGAVNVRT